MRATYHRSLLPAKVSVAHLLSAMSVATGIDFETTSLVLVLGLFFQKFCTSHGLVLGPFKNLDHFQWCSVCNSCKIFLTSKCSLLLFPNSTHKTKTRFANGWEPTNSKLPRPIIMITYLFGNKEQQSDHIYYTLFWQVLGITCPSPASDTQCQDARQKLFC